MECVGCVVGRVLLDTMNNEFQRMQIVSGDHVCVCLSHTYLAFHTESMFSLEQHSRVVGGRRKGEVST